MNLNEEAKAIQSEINDTFTNAYEALQQANIEVGNPLCAGNIPCGADRKLHPDQNQEHHGNGNPQGGIYAG